jgi:hypothetical protein
MNAPSAVENARGNFDASCLCGGIQLRYSGQVGPANYCHCSDCRKVTGSAFNIGVRVDRKDLAVDARTELKSYRSVNDQGRPIERYFCGTCGSPIYTLHPTMAEFAWVKAGIIHQAEVVQPAFEIWTQDRVKWGAVNVPQSYEKSRSG